MNNQNKNIQSKNVNTNQNLENKILKNKINNTKTNNSQVKTPRRYNSMYNNEDNTLLPNNKVYPSNKLDNNDSNLENPSKLPSNDLNVIVDDNSLDSLDNNTDNNLDNGSNISNINMPKKNSINKKNINNNINDPTQKKLNRINNQQKQNKDNNEKTNNKPFNPNENKPKTKTSANTSESSKKQGSNAINNIKKAAQLGSNIGNRIDQGEEASQAIENTVKEELKQHVKAKVRSKLLELFVKFILPILPYIGIALLVIFLVLLLVFTVSSLLDNEDYVVNTIRLNYCEYVNLKWGEGIEENQTISSSEYIKYKIESSDFNTIDDKETLKALIVVYRTNLYANSDNLDSNVCYFEIDEQYEEVENELLDEAMEETDNKVFSFSQTTLSTIEVDDNFTYVKNDDNYRLYQDKMTYNKDWVNSHIDKSHISNSTSGVELNSFSPFAAWYLSDVSKYNYLHLIYHFVSPSSAKGNVYKVVKIGPGSDEYGEYSNMCSDISLSTTSLERQEFIDKVNSFNDSHADFAKFKTNAGKIYDISTSNNFNPEMVVLRAIAEGFSPGGSTYNYWGIGCTNSGGRKACGEYSSFDQGVLKYIETVKKINSVSLFQMQYKYTYIGSNWFNPGSSSRGGCYYFPYIRKYMSEQRASEVEKACQSNATCDGSSCLPTTEEDQSAYTRYQIEGMVSSRTKVFDISVDECSEEEGETVDGNAISDLGRAVANYAVKTYDSWKYSQADRHQDGYVDCSSMVSRAYKHFNVKIYDSSDTSGEIYRWCEKNGKTISGSNLGPGDLIFYNSGSHRSSGNYKSIGHVEMYIGNNQKFGAHTARYTADKQVSVTSYTGGGNFFCRPTK